MGGLSMLRKNPDDKDVKMKCGNGKFRCESARNRYRLCQIGNRWELKPSNIALQTFSFLNCAEIPSDVDGTEHAGTKLTQVMRETLIKQHTPWASVKMLEPDDAELVLSQIKRAMRIKEVWRFFPECGGIRIA